ncbi:MAG: DUF4956 domain-containing protein [Bacteroidales bacterium]|nr:DUF4956 domain-containing protein [Bacteroidales bacterium]
MSEIFCTDYFSLTNISQLLFRLIINLLCAVLLTLIYQKKFPRKDYSFAFLIISTTVFSLIYVLSEIQFHIGFAIGFIALFGIIRYRSKNISIREMTFLFLLITISLLNSIKQLPVFLIILVDSILIILTFLLDRTKLLKRQMLCMLIVYNNLILINTENHAELIYELEKLIGIEIIKIEIIEIDFVRNSAQIKIYYYLKEYNLF